MVRKVKDQVVEDVEELEDSEDLVDTQVVDEDEGDEELEEAADSDPTAGLDGKSKVNLLSVSMHKLNSMSKSELVDFFNKSIAGIGHEADNVDGDLAAKNKSSVAMHAMKEAIAEDLQVVFGDDKELSEEFKNKMTVLFESAVNARVTLVEAELQEAFEQAVDAEVALITEDLLTKVDEYLQYVAEEWIEQNEVAIQPTLKTEITEEFIEGLKNLFVESYIEIPAEKLDVFEALSKRLDELETQLNEALTVNMELTEKAKDFEKDELISQVAEGLTILEAEKFRTLAETVDYDENYTTKLKTLKEHHFSKKRKAADSHILTEEIVYDSDAPEVKEPVKPEMKRYIAALNRSTKAY